ncbi:hypothetical protein [Psychromonas sp. MME2]|uniref:hypothetical protein n=1 Tax=unclassified Psychromonas TaxID=2614957 RepID=UPI00339BE95D
MKDPFLVNQHFSHDELIQQLLNYQFSAPIYHSDVFGHLQEEMPLNNSYSFSELIKQLEILQLWPDFKRLLTGQSESWLIDFSSMLQRESTTGTLQCLVELTDLFTTTTLRLSHLLTAHEWHWQQDSLPLIDTIIKQLTAIKKDIQPKTTVSDEVDFEMIQQTLTYLSRIRESGRP